MFVNGHELKGSHERPLRGDRFIAKKGHWEWYRAPTATFRSDADGVARVRFALAPGSVGAVFVDNVARFGLQARSIVVFNTSSLTIACLLLFPIVPVPRLGAHVRATR